MSRNAEKTIAEQNKRIKTLEGLLTLDELTGLTNRRGFAEIFAREIDRVNRDPEASGLVIMIDIDDFKQVNDLYGHLAGDKCLQVLAQVLREDSRQMDTAARVGGDEFILLFPRSNRKKALKRIIRLAMRLSHLSFPWKGREIPVTASLGIQEYRAGNCLETVLNQADAEMYENKKHKKEKVI